MTNVLLYFAMLAVGLGTVKNNNIGRYQQTNSEFYGNDEEEPSFVHHSRSKRQAKFICVAPNSCISNGIPPSIDERIVSPGQTTTTTTTTTTTAKPTACPTGLVQCYATPGASTCGQRYVKDVVTEDGPATVGAYPWQAYLRINGVYVGSGVLLDQSHLITAAHKVVKYVSLPGNLTINMGVSDPKTTLATSQGGPAQIIRIHPDYNSETLKNDIAVIKLKSAISLGFQKNVAAACKPSSATASFAGQKCMVSGWGKTAFTSNDAPTTPQKQVTVPIVNYTVCRTSLAQANLLGTFVDTYLDPLGEICAGGVAGRDACTYDGGAPLVCLVGAKYTVVGLVAWGKKCGDAGVYGVYVNVPRYLTWIDQTVASMR